MADTAKPKSRIRSRYTGVIAAALLLGAMSFLYYGTPLQGIGPRQPIFFSHRVHAGVKEIHCYFCHPYAERSTNVGLPTVQKCFYCHGQIITKHPQILKERWHYDTQTPVPWVGLFYIPDHVKFNHRPHIKWGKLDCTTCHGDVKTMDRLPSVVFQMGFCIACHKERKAQLDCWLACHH